MANPIQVLLNTKFRNKLIFMCLTAIVPTVLAGIFLLWNLADMMRTSAENELISSADSLKIRLKDSIVTVSNISERAVDNDDIITLLHSNFINSDDYYNFYMQTTAVSEIINAYPQVSEIAYYIDRPGFVNHNVFHQSTDEIKSTYWYQDAQTYSQPRWQIIFDKETEIYSLCLVTPLLNNNGSFMGAAVVYVNPEVYSSLCTELPANYNTIFTVGQGIVFHSTIQDYPTGKFISEMKGSFVYGVSDSNIISDRTALGKLGHTVVSYFDYENTGNLFQVYLVSPDSIFNDEINQVVFTYIGYVFLCIVLSVLLAYLFSSVFSRRIQFLKNKMHDVAEGNFELNDEIKGTDEIFDLYEDLKKMVDRMQTLINDAYKAKIQSESFKLNQVEA